MDRQILKIHKALANPRRLAIVALLKEGRELAVGEVAAAIRLSFKATSKHLLILFHADILERRQISLNMLYHLTAPAHALVSETCCRL